MPTGATWTQLCGVAALGGIGFTVSIFVTGLAFNDAGQQDVAKLAILAASLIAGALGTLILTRALAQKR